ncbi:MAG: DMT family transporter [Candidatus Thorarchaeota archaeon]
MSKMSLAYLALVATTLAWSSSLILAKVVFAEGVGPILFVALRYTLACPFLLTVVLYQQGHNTIMHIRQNWRIVMIAGLAGPFISQILQYIGLNMTTASDALLLLNLTPIFAVVLALPLLREQITRAKMLGLVTATLGVTLIVLNTSPETSSVDPLRLLGDIIVIASTFFFAINGIAGKMAVGDLDSVTLTFYSTLIAVPFIWFSAAVLEDLSVLLVMSAQAWVIVLWVAVINTVVAFILYYESMKHIEASIVQITLNLIAVWGVLMSVLVLGETVTWLQMLGGLLTIVGVILAQVHLSESRRALAEGRSEQIDYSPVKVRENGDGLDEKTAA